MEQQMNQGEPTQVVLSSALFDGNFSHLEQTPPRAEESQESPSHTPGRLRSLSEPVRVGMKVDPLTLLSTHPTNEENTVPTSEHTDSNNNILNSMGQPMPTKTHHASFYPHEDSPTGSSFLTGSSHLNHSQVLSPSSLTSSLSPQSASRKAPSDPNHPKNNNSNNNNLVTTTLPPQPHHLDDPLSMTTLTTTAPQRKSAAICLLTTCPRVLMTGCCITVQSVWEIESCKVVLDLNTHRSRCFGFVKYTKLEDAKTAMKEMNGRRLEHKSLIVKYANTADTRSSGTPSTNVYIKGLPAQYDTHHLRHLFEVYGHIEDCRVLVDMVTGASRGIAFVRFSDVNHAANAIANLNQAMIQGATNPILVKFADTEDERSQRKLRQARRRKLQQMYIQQQQSSMNVPLSPGWDQYGMGMNAATSSPHTMQGSWMGVPKPLELGPPSVSGQQHRSVPFSFAHSHTLPPAAAAAAAVVNSPQLSPHPHSHNPPHINMRPSAGAGAGAGAGVFGALGAATMSPVQQQPIGPQSHDLAPQQQQLVGAQQEVSQTP